MKTKLACFLIITAAVFIAACNPLVPINLEISRVTLNTGINPAATRAAASDVASFRLTVSADDMTKIEKIFTDETISLEIKAGLARIFTLQALDADGNVLFTGSKTVDLTAGQPAEIIIELGYAGFYVTFITNGGTPLPVQYVESGGLVSVFTNPAKTDFALLGWYTDSGLTQSWNLTADIVADDMTLYAKWIEAIPPIPGGSISFGSVIDTGLTINWNKATDNESASNALVYSLFRSELNNISTLSDCLSNGTNLTVTSQADIESYRDKNLTADMTYYYNVIVKDEAGNQAVYGTNSQSTKAAILGNLFTDDFSSNGSLDGSAPDTGGVWSVTQGVIDVSNGVVDTSLTSGAIAYADFSAVLGAGQILNMTFTTENLNTGDDFNNTSWAGVSIFSSGTEKIFIGNIGSDYGWGIGGAAVSTGGGTLSGSVVAPAQTVEFSYKFDTGDWTLNVSGNTASGTATAGLTLDGIRIAADNAGVGDIAISSIKIGSEVSPVYVATTGNDTTGTGTPVLPYATIQKGIDEASARGATEVRVAGGTYTTTAAITLADGVAVLGGYNSADWSRGISANVTTIDSTPSGSPSRVFYASSLSDPATSVDGFTINATMDNDGSYVFDINGSAIIIRNNIVNNTNINWHSYHVRAVNSNITIHNNQFNCIGFGANYSGGIYLSSSGTALITNNIIETEYSGAEAGGVYTDFSGTYDLTIRNNIIDAGYTTQGGAIGTKAVANLGSSTAAITLRADNNIITTDNTSSEFYVVYSTSQNIIIESFKNNVIYSPGSISFAGIYRNAENTNDGGGDDTIYSDISSFETAFANASGNIGFTATDLFTDSANKDFTFGAGATTAVTTGGIDGGSAGWSFTDDIEGTVRTGNGTTGWSIGAYEQD